MSDIRSGIEKRARKAIVQYAFFRLENAIIISIVVLLTFFWQKPFPGWPIWGWPALGVLGVAAIFISSLTDASANAKVQLDLFQERFNPRKVQDMELRNEVEKALEYQRRIEASIGKQRAGVLRDRLEDTAGQLADWVSQIYQLALRLRPAAGPGTGQRPQRIGGADLAAKPGKEPGSQEAVGSRRRKQTKTNGIAGGAEQPYATGRTAT